MNLPQELLAAKLARDSARVRTLIEAGGAMAAALDGSDPLVIAWNEAVRETA